MNVLNTYDSDIQMLGCEPPNIYLDVLSDSLI